MPAKNERSDNQVLLPTVLPPVVTDNLYPFAHEYFIFFAAQLLGIKEDLCCYCQGLNCTICKWMYYEILVMFCMVCSCSLPLESCELCLLLPWFMVSLTTLAVLGLL